MITIWAVLFHLRVYGGWPTKSYLAWVRQRGRQHALAAYREGIADRQLLKILDE